MNSLLIAVGLLTYGIGAYIMEPLTITEPVGASMMFLGACSAVIGSWHMLKGVINGKDD